ncbi:MAG TPA: AAA family ATPase [Acidimicrobiia bacterium]
MNVAELAELGIVVVDDDDAFLDEAKRAFDGSVMTVTSVSDVERMVRDGEIDLVIMGPSFAHERGLAAAADLLDIDSGLAAVLVAESLTAPLLRGALRVGLRDVIEAPLSLEKIEDILSQLEAKSSRRQVTPPAEPFAPQPREGRIITVMSAKGGSGKTVVATNLALLLAERHDAERVAIVDADLQFGDVCLVLQLEPKLTVVNAAQELHRLDESLLGSLLTKHKSGLRVLAAPLEPAFADEISTAAMTDVVQMLKQMFDYVIVDTASLLDELLLSLLERADDVLLVVDMDLPSVKNAKLALETLRLLKFPSSKVKVILNRGNARNKLDEREIERSLKMKISSAIPSDGLVPASLNEGRPVVESAPRSGVARSFIAVAELVETEAPTESQRKGFGRRR